MAHHPCQPEFCSEVIPLIQRICSVGVITQEDYAHLQQAIARSRCLCGPETTWIRTLEDQIRSGTLQLLN